MAGGRIEKLCTKYSGRIINGIRVLEEAGRSKDKHVLYRCQCVKCGTLMLKQSNSLTRLQGCKNCGHISTGLKHRTHGITGSPLYRIWSGMKSRCKNTPGQRNRPEYDIYFRRGIRVCDEWEQNFEEFYSWAINNGYRKGLSIDRIDNDKGYSPANCRWATFTQQANNKRNTITVNYEGEMLQVKELAARLNQPYNGKIYKKIHRGDYGKVYIGGRLSATK